MGAEFSSAEMDYRRAGYFRLTVVICVINVAVDQSEINVLATKSWMLVDGPYVITQSSFVMCLPITEMLLRFDLEHF